MSPGLLQARAVLNRQLRAFFEARQVLEVETPLLARCPVSDPFIECLQVASNGYYLQSSPEYAMKRLLADGSGDIYSLAKVFRAGESGSRHNVEFTLLEWYRLGFDDKQLMAELAELLQSLSPGLVVHYYSYRALFEQSLSLDPHRASLAELQLRVDEYLDMGDYRCEDISTALDLLISQVIEPKLPAGLVFVYDYPACQAALARITPDEQGVPVAKRFEAFLNGMELANGYWELCDGAEQKRRFKQDLALRAEQGLPQVPIDERLVAALDSGLPDCAGVALGVDRLLMQLSGADTIGEVLSFDFGRA
ncbi:MAG: EF-P lysine aminoacylase EpmA [Cellvibrionaceae bacterium]|nr:EF-P lysine aminoacylase EpmA [Cellvibrionaceae bacterium]